MPDEAIHWGIMEKIWTAIAAHISAVTNVSFTIKSRQSVNGGCINTSTILQGNASRYFVKLNQASRVAMFAAEAQGLKEITGTRTVRVPQPVCWGEAEGSAYLVLEFLDLGHAGEPSMQTLGQQLARMHRTTAPHFGWRIDNTIGSTPQINTACSDWVEFWQRHRLGYQLTLAEGRSKKSLQGKGQRLMADVGVFFANYLPTPALLHGDLWSGNAAAVQSQPVIFDPAVYYGDREADIAMTELFGGFSPRFYQAYQEAWPLDSDYRARKTLYNLYHVLNHLNLFGGGYGAQAEGMIDLLLSEIR